MKFVSYAQNFEDIRLWRALKFFDKGFYIDVGANDPSFDSVTRAFYDRGWTGINIEPVQAFHRLLSQQRPKDINLQYVASDVNHSDFLFYEVPGTGLSTMVEAIAKEHEESGREVNKRSISSRTLNSICDEYVIGDIHFLKIDVEGHEELVLQGIDLKKWRPWIILVETPFNRDQVWEKIIIEAHYRAILFDGLNTFYLAEEHMNLAEAFETPPSYLDDFHLCYGHNYSYPVNNAESAIRSERDRADKAEAELATIKQSKGWRAIRRLKSLIGK